MPVSQPPITSGLRYEDLLNEEEKEVKEALSLADPDVLTARSRRLKRAIDLSYKKKSLQVRMICSCSWNPRRQDDVLWINHNR